jgi:hypothetical protein
MNNVLESMNIGVHTGAGRVTNTVHGDLTEVNQPLHWEEI